MAEVQAGQQEQGQDQKQEGEKDAEQAEQQKRSYTEEEWNARQADFDRKANKIRRNAARDAELKFRREMSASQQPGEQRHEQQQQQNADAEPQRADFDDYEAYLRAVGRWEGRQAAREERKEAAKQAEQRAEAEQHKKSADEFKKRANAVMEEIADFAEVIEDAEDVMITPTMGREIQDSPAGPRILYELAKNPEEAQRIAELPPKAQVREILKMESRFEAEAAARKAKGKDKKDEDAERSEEDDETGENGEEEQGESADAKGKDAERNADGTFKPNKRSAPPPIEPVTGRGANTNPLPSDKDDGDTWLRKRRAQLEREGRA